MRSVVAGGSMRVGQRSVSLLQRPDCHGPHEKILAMRCVRQLGGQVGTRLVRRPMPSSFPEKAVADIVDDTVAGNVGGATIPPVELCQFIGSEPPVFGRHSTS